MSEHATFQFYTVTECGYYRRGESDPHFGSLADILQQLRGWVNHPDARLVDTCTYEVGDYNENLHPAYCFAIEHDAATGDYLVVTWNETPSSEEQFASVVGDSRVGEAEVLLTDVPAGSIPGYATYFWFVPAEDLFATIQFQHQMNGHPELKKYLNEYMAKFTSYVVLDEGNGDVDLPVCGYRANATEPPRHYYPRFKSKLITTEGNQEFIRTNQPHIRKIIRKNELGSDYVGSLPISALQMIFRQLGIVDPPQPDDEIKARYEINYHPNEGELDTIISQWERDRDSKWDDVGFQMRGDSKTYWLSRSLPKVELYLDVERINDEIVDVGSLLEAVRGMRGDLLEYVPGQRGEEEEASGH